MKFWKQLMQNYYNSKENNGMLPTIATLATIGNLKKKCSFCYGHGIWLGEWIPIYPEEVSYADSDPCPECGAENFKEDYPPWQEDNKEDLKNKFKLATTRFRGLQCAESLDIQANETPQKY